MPALCYPCRSSVILDYTVQASVSTNRKMIQLKRVYEPAEFSDGVRLLVDRLWPRKLKKEDLKIDGWQKDVAPCDALRQWFGHEPAKWGDFLRRYHAELDAKPDSWQPILKSAQHGTATLLYSAHDIEHNNAVALKIYLEKRLRDFPSAK